MHTCIIVNFEIYCWKRLKDVLFIYFETLDKLGDLKSTKMANV